MTEHRRVYLKTRDQARYAERVSQGRCVACGAKLPADYINRTCQDCVERYREYRENRKVRQALIPDHPQAPPVAALAQRRAPEGPPRCLVCHLLTPHVCVAGSALDRRAW